MTEQITSTERHDAVSGTEEMLLHKTSADLALGSVQKTSPSEPQKQEWQIKAGVPGEPAKEDPAVDVSPAVEASTGGQSLKEQVDSLETVLMQHTQALQMVAELLVNVQAQAAADRIRAAQQYVKLTEELKAAPSTKTALGWIVAMLVAVLSFVLMRVPGVL
uniref:Uncharacterized protein n=1 Tax=Auxenochlorella protothecoides TaxID=3075 RepID=A0A1D2AF97_AUXPR